MIAEGIRTERRYGVTSQLSPNAMRNLYALRVSETWPDLLDVLEQVCIEVETVLINTAPEEEKKVLANHQMSKVAWMMFSHMQQKLDENLNSYMANTMTVPLIPRLTAEEQERANMLNPTIPLDVEGEDLPDGYGPY